MSILSKPISDPAKKVGLKTTIFKSTNKKLEAYLAAYEERWGKCDKNLIVDALLNFAIDKDSEFKGKKRRETRKIASNSSRTVELSGPKPSSASK